MPKTAAPGSVVPCPVEHIAGIWRFHREPGPVAHAYSTPGHLFHFMTRGHYELTTNGRRYDVRAGDIIYYHGNETVTCRWSNEPVEMISIAIHAPALEPLPLSRRVFRAGKTLARLFLELHTEYYAPAGDPARLRLFGLLHEMLLHVGMLPAHGLSGGAACGEDESHLSMARERRRDVALPAWDDIEGALRRERLFRADIDSLCERAHCSRATLNRLCRKATGMSPQERLRVVRMEEARGLLLYSPLSLSAIAEELGFGRQHEFTREFSHYFGHPPSRLRPRA